MCKHWLDKHKNPPVFVCTGDSDFIVLFRFYIGRWETEEIKKKKARCPRQTYLIFYLLGDGEGGQTEGDKTKRVSSQHP
ncbi:hypothetical protein JIR001_05740 [Polycladomyces abyssicola]|uniref:NYN domain-containing protein n=1 Tax=Polycladomyces abyssicola TaxID=1125966 RepID=A0A8D5ZMW3_9BACL|nr:hypothetical protein JIR001_05740 [Polycladomyces abyssicola]